jgi:hypothetical protein
MSRPGGELEAVAVALKFAGYRPIGLPEPLDKMDLANLLTENLGRSEASLLD